MAHRDQPAQSASQSTAEIPLNPPPPDPSSRSRIKTQKTADHEAANELKFMEYWTANRKEVKPSQAGSAQARLAELRHRVAAMAADSRASRGL